MRKSNCIKLLSLLGSLALFIAVPDSLAARSCRANLIPNGTKFSCLNCHQSAGGGGPRNAFGEDVFTAISGTSSCDQFWGPALAKMDSDGDGFTNGVELQDPCGLWVFGDPQPGVLASVSNPGSSSSKPPLPALTPCATPTPTPSPIPTASPTPTPFNSAILVGQTIPTQIPAQHGVPVQITMQNNGTKTWSSAAGYSLAVTSDACNLTSPLTRLPLNSGVTVEPGASFEFSATLTAPPATGDCLIEFRMIEELVEFFGASVSVTPSIIAAVNNAIVTNHTIPAKMAPGQTLGVGITFRNTGNTIWLGGPPPSHILTVTSDPGPIWSTPAMPLFGQDVKPAQSFQFLGTLTAPPSPGPCQFTLRMADQVVPGAFGQILNLTINVQIPSNGADRWEIYE